MFITKEEIFAQTNGGLDVIIRLCPDAEQCQDQKKKFKLRGTEKTASAKLKRTTDGIWLVTDFGDDGKGKNAINFVMQEKRMDFAEAIQWIAAEFGLIGSDGKTAKLYELEVRPATSDETEGLMTFARKADFSDSEIKVMFAESLLQWLDSSEKQKKDPKESYARAKEVLKRYGWSSLESYTKTVKGKTITTIANDNYPIFLMEDGEFCKLYQPKSADKKYRFMYYPNGALPKDHVWGIKQVKEAYQKLQKEANEWDHTEADTEKEKDKDNKRPQDKIDCILITSGERDSMNAALMGYYPVWQNSETKGISKSFLKLLDPMAKEVVNIPDIDSTGINMGVKGALENINLSTAWLPFELLTFKDQRGNPCKDLRDFLSVKDEKGLIRWRKKDFDRLVKTAKKCQFWSSYYKDKRLEWSIDQTNLLYYLWCSGFRKLKNQGFKDGFQFIHINGHIIREVDSKQIRNYVRLYLDQHYQDNKLMNMFLRSTVLNDAQLEYLEDIEVNFTDHSHDLQLFYFKNEAWKVTAAGIEKIRHTDIAKFKISEKDKSGVNVWEHEILPHRVDVLPPMFEELLDEDGNIMIRPINKECPFFKYVIATSRIHWRKEEKTFIEANATSEIREQYFRETAYELDGIKVRSSLTEEECQEQMKHLANKLFILGYLLHRYKNQSKPWGVYLMDAKLSDEGQSWGRSGKSVFVKCIRQIINTKTISGRNTDITRNAYLYDGVTEFTKILNIDDCHEFLKYDVFFTALTDSLQVNPKFVREFELPFSKSPKFVFTSNYALKNPDPSTEARLLYGVFSDFFHEQTSESDYLESRSPKDWIGKNLLDQDYTESEWNLFLNLCAQAVSFYLRMNKKIVPPMTSINLRSLKSTMGDSFFDWASGYFSDESDNLNTELLRSKVYDNCMDTCKFKILTAKEFGKRLKAFIKYMNATVGGYEFNPPDIAAPSGRIIKKNQENQSVEYIYIRKAALLMTDQQFAEESFKNTPDL